MTVHVVATAAVADDDIAAAPAGDIAAVHGIAAVADQNIGPGPVGAAGCGRHFRRSDQIGLTTSFEFFWACKF